LLERDLKKLIAKKQQQIIHATYHFYKVLFGIEQSLEEGKKNY